MARFTPADFARDVRTLFSMLWAALRGKYRWPWVSLLCTLGCAVYVISPVDFLPDVMPLLGITDDGAFILLTLALWKKDLTAYRQSLARPKPGQQVLDAQAVKPQTPREGPTPPAEK